MLGRRDKNLEDMNVGCLIGANSVIDGDFTSSENTRIDGEIRGNVSCKAKIYVGSKGKVNGNITTENIMISGEVLGDVISSNRVEITSSGKVVGDIQAKVLVIDENAVFNGNCNMSAAVKKEKEPKSAATVS